VEEVNGGVGEMGVFIKHGQRYHEADQEFCPSCKVALKKTKKWGGRYKYTDWVHPEPNSCMFYTTRCQYQRGRSDILLQRRELWFQA
jgi:hypothetical protein